MSQPLELGSTELASLRRFASRLTRDAHEAEDIVQETALAFLCSPPASRFAVRSWMRVVSSRIAHRLRGQRRRVPTLELLDTAEEITPVNELLGELRLGIANLPAKHRRAVTMRYMEGLSIEEIGRRTGVNVNTVYSRLQRGHVALRARLERKRKSRRWSLPAILVPWFDRGASARRVPALVACLGVGLITLLGVLAWNVFSVDSAKPETTLQVAGRATERSTPIVQPPSGVFVDHAVVRTALVPAGDDFAVVRGVVVDEWDRPVAGASISAHQAVGESVVLATSAFDGSFECVVDNIDRMRGPIVQMAGGIALQADRDGWGASYVHVVPGDGNEVELEEPLRLASQSTSLAVPVLLPTGVPRENVTVTFAAKSTNLLGGSGSTLLWAPQQVATLGFDGVFRLADLKFGEGRVIVAGPGFVSQSRPVLLDGPVALEPFRMRRGRTLHGLVLDAAGDPQAGVHVTLVASRVVREVTTVTEPDGSFRMSGVRAGAQRLSLRGLDGLGLDRAIAVDRREVQLGALVLHPMVPHRVRLVSEDGQPVVRQVRFNTTVESGRWARAATTNEDGWVIDAGVPTDEVELVLLSDRFQGVAGLPLMSVSLRRGEERVITVPADLEVPVEIAVRFSAGRVPPGTLLELVPPGAKRGGRFVLGANGRLTTLAPPGTYDVRIHAPGLGTIAVEPIQLDASAVCIVDVPRMSEVTIPDASCYERVVVRTCSANEGRPHVLDSAPARSNMLLLPGEYEFTLTRMNGSVVCQTVALHAGGSVALGSSGFARSGPKTR